MNSLFYRKEQKPEKSYVNQIYYLAVALFGLGIVTGIIISNIIK